MNGSETSGTKKKTRTRVVRTPMLERRIILAYNRYPSLRQTATLVGASKDFVLAVLRKHGIDSRAKTTARVRLTGREGRETGRIAKWLRENADRKLPRDYRHIARRAGVSYNALKCYFYRRRRQIKIELDSIPSLQALNATLRTPLGKDVSTAAFATYRFLIDRFSLEVWLEARLENGEIAAFPIPKWEDFVKRAKEG